MWESVGKGLGAGIAAAVLFFILMDQEKKEAAELEFLKGDPAVAAEAAYAEGEVYFYHWLREIGFRDEAGDLSTKRVWSVVREQDIAPLILERYPERQALLVMNRESISLENEKLQWRALIFAAKFNMRMAELLIHSLPEPES